MSTPDQISAPTRERLSALTAEACYAALVVMLALNFAALRSVFAQELEPASLALLVEGNAATPFQYRVLTPWLIGAMADIAGLARTDEQLAGLLGLVETGALVALVYSCRMLLLAATGHEAISRYLPLILFVTLPFNLIISRYNNFHMPYDIPAAAFFAFGLLFLYERRYFPYYLVFAVGLLNRETIGFLAVIFLLTQWRRLPARALAAHIAAQSAAWIVIKLALYWLFSGSEGAGLAELRHSSAYGEQPADLHIHDNLTALFEPIHWPHMLGAFGYLWIPLLVFRKHITDPFARRSLYALIPFLGLSMTVANIFELRIFADFYPVVLLALGTILAELHRRGPA